jgi:phosphoglucomutase
MANPEPIEVLARRWLDLDRDETTRKEIEALLRDNNKNELEQRLRNRIAFGTAGLRASMKAGFVHMNSLTVLQASHGLAQYITEPNTVSLHESKGPRRFKVVIGHDARHNSERFARLTAAAFLDRKFQVLWLGKAHGTAGNDKKHENDMVSKPEGQRASPLSNAKLNQDHGTLSSPSIRNGFVHTPLVPFAVKHYGADAGVMITASHNPKNDNGYKVYWNNGCQIIPPHDRGIAAAIETIGEVDTWDATNVDRDPKTTNIFDLVNEAYFHSIHHLSPEPSYSEVTPRFMYTPMHGVGLPFMRQAVETLHCAQAMQIVEAQADPDPEFPTVPFPNPEETGALDLAKREAEANDCSLILANDPDADRFAAVERLDDGEWHQFTGNEMGILLASYLLETYEGERSKLVMLASAVSSRMLAVMAKKEGFYFRETLTGFKWLGNVAQELKRNGYDPVFAYEEAIGYMFPSVVWDKDGIAAAAVFLRAISVWRKQGLTPYRKLQQLYKKYG